MILRHNAGQKTDSLRGRRLPMCSGLDLLARTVALVVSLVAADAAFTGVRRDVARTPVVPFPSANRTGASATGAHRSPPIDSTSSAEVQVPGHRVALTDLPPAHDVGAYAPDHAHVTVGMFLAQHLAQIAR